jgi:hypothetical protein
VVLCCAVMFVCVCLKSSYLCFVVAAFQSRLPNQGCAHFMLDFPKSYDNIPLYTLRGGERIRRGVSVIGSKSAPYKLSRDRISSP